MGFIIKTKKGVPQKYKKIAIRKNISYDKTIPLIAEEITKKKLSNHKIKTIDYLDNNNINIKTLVEAIHLNHSPEIHNSIINNSHDIAYVKLFYGDNKVRIESNGHIMAIILQCKNVPKDLISLQGWECFYSNNKIVLYTKNNNLINGEVELFRYTSSLRIYKAEVVGANKQIIRPSINLEGLDYWRLLEGNWETMDSVHWENYKGVY